MINFICRWGGEDENTRKTYWSGTPYGIEEALKKRTQVNDIPLRKENRLEIVSGNVKRKILYGGDDFNIINTINGIREINKKNICPGEPCIVFTEFNSNNVSDSYSYQDLTVDFIIRFGKEHPELAKYASLPDRANRFALERRTKLTSEFNNNCRGLFTMSKWLAEDLVMNTGVAPERVHWVGGGCNLQLNCIDVSQKQGYRFLFVGKDWERKNGPLVLMAFKRLKAKFRDVELYIAGPEVLPFEPSDGVHFLGRLSYEELIPYYNMCDYFVMPSRFEAYGIVFAEALIYGLPCIGKNHFAMPEFIEDGGNGYLIQDDDVEELTYKMELLLNHTEIRRDVIKNRDLYIRQYSWDSVASRMLEVMKADGYSV